MLSPTIQLAANGNLFINGGEASDVTEVSSAAGGQVRVAVQTAGETSTELFPRSKVSRVLYDGAGGNDTFRNLTNLPSQANGGAGNDALYGGTGVDDLHGDDGSDVLIGNQGADQLFGGTGSDVLQGGAGLDGLFGGTGADRLYGDSGNDELDGGADDDRIYGDVGHDSLIGGAGDDLLDGGSDNDKLDGGAGADQNFGRAGNDTLKGGAGSDQLVGGGGRDSLSGGNGNDRLLGEAADDVLDGGMGDDTLLGNDGNDSLDGGPGPDSLFGGNGNDVLSGGVDHDKLQGGSGADRLFGGSGSNHLDGNGGGDRLYSESNADNSINGQVVLAGGISVRDFGAVGNGVADDTRAIQNAINAAQGRTLYIDPGTYRLTDSILVGSNTTVRGAGASSVLAFDWSDQKEGPSFHLGNRNRKNEDRGDVRIRLSDFVVQGGSNGMPYGEDDHSVTHGISLRKVTDVEVTGVEVRKTSGFGIVNTGVVNGRFTANRILDVGRDGITSFPLVDESDRTFRNYPLSNLVISDNDIRNVGDDAIAVHAGTAVTANSSVFPNKIVITDNTIVGRVSRASRSQGRGIALSGVRNVTVSGNDISNTVSTGILVQHWWKPKDRHSPEFLIRSLGVRVTDNTITNAGRSFGIDRVKFGLQVKGSDGVEIDNNIIRNSADRGIDVRDANRIAMSGNVVSGSGGEYGVLVAGSKGDPVLSVYVTDNSVQHSSETGMLLHLVAGVTKIRNGLFS